MPSLLVEQDYRKPTSPIVKAMNDPSYRSISVLVPIAIISCIVALGAFWAVSFVSFAAVSVLIGAWSLRDIRRYQLGGFRLASASLCVAAAILVLASARHVHLYVAESLPGHIRVDFAALEIGQTTRLDKFADKPICLKGYVLAPSHLEPTLTLCLSPEGDRSQREKAITVSLPFEWRYQHDPVVVSGILKVNPDSKDPTRRYVLEGKMITRCNTKHGLARRVSGFGC